jgi:hypothetical protein
MTATTARGRDEAAVFNQGINNEDERGAFQLQRIGNAEWQRVNTRYQTQTLILNWRRRLSYVWSIRRWWMA